MLMRFSILTLLGLVTVAALGCTALLNSSASVWHITSILAFASFAGAVPAAFYSQGYARACCLGFAAVGYPYYASHVSWLNVIQANPGIEYLYGVLRERLPPDPAAYEEIGIAVQSFDTKTYFY